MPDPVRLLNTLRQAVAAFRATPGRRGRLVCPPDAEDVVIAGDLHGNVENLRLLLKQANLAAQPRRHLVLQELVHGSFFYPTGGDKSHQLLDLLAALKCQYPQRVHMLLGNHELSQWTERAIMKGERDLNELFRQGVRTAYGVHADEVYAAYGELVAVVPVALRTANRVFLCHSIPSAAHLATFDPAVLERDVPERADLVRGGSIHALVWGRDTSLPTVAAFLSKVDADLVITGHIPCDQGYAVPNERQLILDALGTPACWCRFPADQPLTQQELVAGIATL